jgi:hypothetical protein
MALGGESEVMLDISTFQLGVGSDDDAEEEGVLLGELERRARAFVQSHAWAPPIKEMLLAFGVGGVIGLYLVRFEQGISSGEGKGATEIWVVVGDLPSIYFETEGSETRAAALRTYCDIAEAWADAVLSGADCSECFPVPVQPTEEHARMLKSRLQTIREEFILELA